MADIKPIGKALFLREEELRRGIELMFFAYRDFTGEADSILAEQNMGRAHHRAIYFHRAQPRHYRQRTSGHPQHHQTEPVTGPVRPC